MGPAGLTGQGRAAVQSKGWAPHTQGWMAAEAPRGAGPARPGCEGAGGGPDRLHGRPGPPAVPGIDDSALQHPDFPWKRRRSASAEPIEESALDFKRGLRARGAILS